jgi:DNA-binding MarR family transcriptional regulator
VIGMSSRTTRGTKSALANDAWEALLASHAVLMKGFAADHVWRDVSMREYDVLYALAKSRSPMTMSELHRGVLLSQPALSRMVDRLFEDGLVARVADVSDKRSVRLSLTDEGVALQRRVGLMHARGVARSMKVLSVEELETLERICEKLRTENDTSEKSAMSRKGSMR